jgi:acyl-coenzyme A synthetase/AMP-(fatty) acid ligase
VGAGRAVNGYDDVSREEASAWRAAGFWRDRLITDDLDRHAARVPGQVAYIDHRRSITYAEVVEESNQIARGLRRLGVERQDAVAIQLPNCIEFALLHLALVRIGAITTLITPMSRSREVQGMLRNARTRWFVIADRIRGFDHAEMASQLSSDGSAANGFRTIVMGEPRPGQIGWPELLELGERGRPSNTEFDSLRPDPDEVAEIVFTSGTTSEAKGVLHTHNTLLAPQVAIAKSLGIGPGSILHMASTVAHQTGFLNGIRLPIQVGGCCVLLRATRCETSNRNFERERHLPAGPPSHARDRAVRPVQPARLPLRRRTDSDRPGS